MADLSTPGRAFITFSTRRDTSRVACWPISARLARTPGFDEWDEEEGEEREEEEGGGSGRRSAGVKIVARKREVAGLRVVREGWFQRGGDGEGYQI